MSCHRRSIRLVCVAALACLCLGSVAQTSASPTTTVPEPQLEEAPPAPLVEKIAPPGKAMPSSPAERRWVQVPRLKGRLTARDMGLVINTADPYSVAVGEYYARRRHIPPDQVLRVELPVHSTLNVVEFGELYARIRDHMGPQVQGLALAWTQPYAVGCNSITSAITLGFEPEACANTCAPTKPSRYFNSASVQPFTDLGLRPSMLLASRSVKSAKAMIDRGVASDHQLGKRGGLLANAVFVNTSDRARNVRALLFPPKGLPGELARFGVQVNLRDGADTSPLQRVVLYQTGLTHMDYIDKQQWVAGALADHLTSSGGQLLDSGGQMSALEWLESGATASYGTVSEPCNHLQKFPHPQVLLMHYMQGATALEAYWRSVAWPAQGVFVGEPLAAPF
jgi:uncharacterized protein (TIGR03790 family)